MGNKLFLACLSIIFTMGVLWPSLSYGLAQEESRGSFEKSIGNTGSMIGSAIANASFALGASIDTAANIADSARQATQRHYSIVRQAENHLMSAGHQMLWSLPELIGGAIQTILPKQSHSFLASATGLLLPLREIAMTKKNNSPLPSASSNASLSKKAQMTNQSNIQCRTAVSH